MRSAKVRPAALLLAFLLLALGGDLLAQGGGDVIPPGSPPETVGARTGKPAARLPGSQPGP